MIEAVQVKENSDEVEDDMGEVDDEIKEGLGQDGLRGDPQGEDESEEPDVKKNRIVHTPTRMEVEDHERTHCPFKPWCRHCVKGRGTNAQHRRKADVENEEGDHKVPRVSMDYFFMSKRDEDAKENPLIAMVDESTGERYARAAGQKGIGSNGEQDWLIKDMVEELRAWGHAGGTGGHIILKSDGEPAVKSLRDAVGKYLGGRVVPENPPKGESQSNGRIEETVKTIRGYAKVLKSQIEEEAKIKLDGTDVIVQWIVRWAAMLPSRFLKGKDGKTAFQRRRGRKCEIPTEKMGEKVWYKELKGKDDTKGKFETDWKEGLWLGHARSSNEIVIGTREGVVRAWAIRKMPREEQWDGELIKGMKGTPARPNPATSSPTIPVTIHFEEKMIEDDADEKKKARKEDKPRGVYIMGWMLQEFGYTDDCPACRAKRAGLSNHKLHTEVCRKRIEEALAKDEKGKQTIERADERWMHWTASKIEKDDKKSQQEEAAKEKVQNSVTVGTPAPPHGPIIEPHEAEQEEEKGAAKDEESPQEEKEVDEDKNVPVPDDVAEEVEKPKRSHEGEPEVERKKLRAGKIGADMKRVLENMDMEHEKRQKIMRDKRPRDDHADEESGGFPQLANVPIHRLPSHLPPAKKFREDELAEDALLQLHPAVTKKASKETEAKAIMKLMKVKHKDDVEWDRGRRGEKDNSHEEMEKQLMEAWDDITGRELNAREVQKARMTEIGYAINKKVWTKISRAEAKRRGWKIVKTRWIDINKGDDANPVYRSRLVAKEFNNQDAEGLFAGTPPLEALRILMSRAATRRKDGQKSVIMINDVSRAFFEAPMQRHLCVELPEDTMSSEDRRRDVVGLLNQSLYGTRDAAANFQKEVAKYMEKNGFRRGRYNPCTYHHAEKQLACLVHGDDFVTVGSRFNCDWLRGKLEMRFEIKTKIVGAGDDEVKEERILNRVIRITDDGWEYEADQRHADIIIKEMNLQDAKGVASPGEDDKRWQEEEDHIKLDGNEARKYRGLVARANYLALDRPDIQFSTKEVCRGMCHPSKGDLRKLRRLARYLVTSPRQVIKYEFQNTVGELTSFTDSDFAGCRKTARSTSGGIVMAGTHFLKSWSSTQKTVALSSGEAELTALVKCSCETIGILQLMQDWGYMLESQIYVDSSAAIGVVSRRGAGKLRHVRVGQLWVQEKAESGELQYRKVRGDQNPSDALTKPLTGKEVERYMAMMNIEKRSGRAQKGLEVTAG